VTAELPDPVIVAGRLRAAGCVYAEEEAALLLAEAADRAAGHRRTADRTAGAVRAADRAAAPGQAAEVLADLLGRRIAGEPLEHVLGWVEFLGRRVAVAPGVFVPRRRTELLVEIAAGLVAPGDELLDLCCGCGAIGAALAAAVPGVRVTASDIEPAAVAAARRNLQGLPAARVVEGDFLDPVPAGLRGRLALIVCNAPYVPSEAIAFMPSEARDHEPRRALDGGPDGLDWHRRLAREAGDWLVPGGGVVVESSEDQAPVSAAAFAAAGFTVRIVRDEARDATAVVASRPGRG